MLTVTDPRGSVMLTNSYDLSGRVQQQTLADASVLTFSYTRLLQHCRERSSNKTLIA